jgi:biopolymer transport protein ExbD
MRFQHEFKKAQLRVDITPLIDVVFLLLIFFMLGSQFVYTTKIKVELPRARTAQMSTDTIVAITITSKNELYLDDKTITFAELNKIFKALTDGKITIISDKETPFGTVIKVWDLARENNISQINIETRS